MSSRYGFDSLSERQQRQYESSHVGITELPLPTYEEVVGAVGHTAILKTEAQLLGSATTSPCEDALGTSAEHPEVHYEPRYASSRKSSVLLLIGMILIPLCALIVFIQVKGCADSHQQSSKADLHDDNSIDSLYNKCLVDRNNLLQLITDFLGSSGSKKLLQNYEFAISNKEKLESSLRDLREQLKILNLEKEKLQWLLNNATKTFPNLTNFDDHNIQVKNSTPMQNIEIKTDSSKEITKPIKKKSFRDQITEWSKISPNTAIQIETAMQEVQDFINSSDKI